MNIKVKDWRSLPKKTQYLMLEHAAKKAIKA